MAQTEERLASGSEAEVPTSASTRFACFDGLRAIAAFSVFFSHFYATSYRRNGTDFPEQVHFLIDGMGSFGVAVFFVISGFLLGRPFLEAQQFGTSSPALGPFWLRRFLRIFPAYWLALAGLVLFGLPHTERMVELLFHSVLLQGYRAKWAGGGLFVAWTLVAEVGFYLLLPLLAFGLRCVAGKKTAPTSVVGAQVRGLICLAVIGLGARVWWATSLRDRPLKAGAWFPLKQIDLWVVGYLDWFALGMLLAVASVWIARGGRVPGVLTVLGRHPWLSWMFAAGLLWVVSRARFPMAFVGTATSAQLILRASLDGVAAALVVLPAVVGDQSKGGIRWSLRLRPVVWLGVISYGIYLWHTIYLRVIARWLLEDRISPSRAIQLALLLALTISTAAVSYYLVERPLVRLGHKAPGQPRMNGAPEGEIYASSRTNGRVKPGVTVAVSILVVTSLVLASAAVGATIGANAPAPLRKGPSQIFNALTVLDAFDRGASTDLGATPTGQPWRQRVGRWTAGNGFAEQAASGGKQDGLAIVAAHANGMAAVRIAEIGTGAGLAFRCVGPSDCWRLEAVPAKDRWELSVTSGGRTTLAGVVNAVPANGSDIAVEMAGSHIRVLIDGIKRLGVENATLARENGAGIVGGTDARLSKFSVIPAQFLVPATGEVGAHDEFAASGPLAGSIGAGTWRVLRGQWTTDGGQARAMAPESPGPMLALLDTTRNATSVSATIGTAAVGFGVAFRCQDANNCWWVEAAPGYGTWVVWRIVGGTIERVTQVGLAPAALGTTVEVRLSGNKIDFLFNGDLRRTLVDPLFAGQAGVGLATGPGPAGEFARFWSTETRFRGSG
ncbi:MAG: acyltransferase [Acidimicrobiia bacterium]|nr:acyltransferase [Acidimicrobiia bacterium]